MKILCADGEFYGRNGSGRSRDGRGPPPQRQARERPLQNGVAAGEQAAREQRKEGTGSEELVAGIPSGTSPSERVMVSMLSYLCLKALIVGGGSQYF